MNYPDFINAFPALDLPFPRDVVESHAVRSDKGLVVFFQFKKDFDLPEHSHLAQWGTLIHGEVTLTIDGVAKTYTPGESWDIASGVVHGGQIKAGTFLIDVFEEPDRYPLID